MRSIAFSLIATITAMVAMAMWSLAWVQWYDTSLFSRWLKPSSDGTLTILVLVGFALLGFAKECSNRAANSLSQLLFIGATGLWGLAAILVSMNLTPLSWFPKSPTTSQAVTLFLAGWLTLAQASRATATMNGEPEEDEEEQEKSTSSS